MAGRFRRPGVLEVDLGALARNYQRLRRTAAPAELAAVVKANAYGLGLGPVARCLSDQGCSQFFVAMLEEGLELRRALPDAEIYVLDGLAGHAVDAFVAGSLVPVLNNLTDTEIWAGTGRDAVLHVDTGMSRLGLSPAEVDLLLGQPSLAERLKIVCLMTHLACADESDHPLNVEQVRRFESVRDRFPRVRTSFGNSAGIFLGREHHGDMVRAGIGLYGGNPFSGRPSPVEPVASLKARILQIRTMDSPGSVGYGATYTAQSGDRIAIVGVGYADGYPRQLGNRAQASINGVRVPVVGRVSMDLLALDVSALPMAELTVGQYVELFGRDVGIDEIAEACGTISYEILTGLNARLERVYSD